MQHFMYDLYTFHLYLRHQTWLRMWSHMLEVRAQPGETGARKAREATQKAKQNSGSVDLKIFG